MTEETELKPCSGWQPIETAPNDASQILIVMPIIASPHHPTAKVGSLLYWEYACVLGVDVHNQIDLEDAGFKASDFQFWQPVPAPPESE